MSPTCVSDAQFDGEHYQLRSTVRDELVVPLAKNKLILGRRRYRYYGPSLWNAFPQRHS